MSEEVNSIDIISPPIRKVGDIEISPLKIGQIPAIMRALKGIDLSNGFSMNDLPALIADHGDKIIEAVAVATKRQASEIAEMDGDAFMELLLVVIEVNSDFFVRRALPAMNSVLERMGAKKTSGAGPTASSH